MLYYLQGGSEGGEGEFCLQASTVVCGWRSERCNYQSKTPYGRSSTWFVDLPRQGGGGEGGGGGRVTLFESPILMVIRLTDTHTTASCTGTYTRAHVHADAESVIDSCFFGSCECEYGETCMYPTCHNFARVSLFLRRRGLARRSRSPVVLNDMLIVASFHVLSRTYLLTTSRCVWYMFFDSCVYR